MLGERLQRALHLAFCMAVFAFLIAPMLIVVPLSFNAEPYFTFTEGMLSLDPEAYSLRWYRNVIGDSRVATRTCQQPYHRGVGYGHCHGARGSCGPWFGQSPVMPGRQIMMGLLISPMVTPIIVSAAGMFFFFSELGLGQTHLGLILAHAVLGTPFVVITVTATLSGFDVNLSRAASSLGAGPLVIFRRVQLPVIAPGVIAGALFAFATSFDEIVTVLFLGGLDQRTLPRQMWAGIREQISPEILAVATLLMVFAVLFLVTVEWLRRRGVRHASR